MGSVDLDLVRSVFDPDCVVVGTMEEGTLDDYLHGLEEGLAAYDATMHFKGNQYIDVDGDRAFVETWVIGYHMEAPGSPIDGLVLALTVQGRRCRAGDDWKVVRHEAVANGTRLRFPRPLVGPPPYPRPTHRSRRPRVAVREHRRQRRSGAVIHRSTRRLDMSHTVVASRHAFDSPGRRRTWKPR